MSKQSLNTPPTNFPLIDLDEITIEILKYVARNPQVLPELVKIFESCSGDEKDIIQKILRQRGTKAQVKECVTVMPSDIPVSRMQELADSAYSVPDEGKFRHGKKDPKDFFSPEGVSFVLGDNAVFLPRVPAAGCFGSSVGTVGERAGAAAKLLLKVVKLEIEEKNLIALLSKMILIFCRQFGDAMLYAGKSTYTPTSLAAMLLLHLDAYRECQQASLDIPHSIPALKKNNPAVLSATVLTSLLSSKNDEMDAHIMLIPLAGMLDRFLVNPWAKPRVATVSTVPRLPATLAAIMRATFMSPKQDVAKEPSSNKDCVIQ